MTDLVLDTSAYSHLRRGDEQVGDRLAMADVVYVPTIVIGELRAGFELGRRIRENVIELETFLDEPFVRAVSADANVAIRYGRLFAELRRAGTPVPVNDIWIAACAQEVGAPIVTFDGDFLRIPGVDVEHFPRA
jgi:tRNA(fMet)-specific endonuclease VapC